MKKIAVASAVRPKVAYATVPELWPGGTIACIGTGPSLMQEDVDALRGRVDAVIVINDAYKLAPWADVLYACDVRWWNWHRGVPSFKGLKYALQRAAARWPGVQILNNTGDSGLERKRTGLRTGRNSGYQSVNLAVHLGAARIVLLGYDMQRTHGKAHYFGEHPNKQASPFQAFRAKFEALSGPLTEANVAVINCSRETALTCFPRMSLESAVGSHPNPVPMVTGEVRCGGEATA